MVSDTVPSTDSEELLAAAHDAFAVIERHVQRCHDEGLLQHRRGPVAVLPYTGLHGLVDLGISGVLHGGKGLDPVALAHDLVDNLISGP